MYNDQQITESKDPHLWDIAKKRASFKTHLTIYLIMSALFWALWYATGGTRRGEMLPWPVWPMFGWGIGVAFHYYGSYVSTKDTAVDREYEKLKRENIFLNTNKQSS